MDLSDVKIPLNWLKFSLFLWHTHNSQYFLKHGSCTSLAQMLQLITGLSALVGWFSWKPQRVKLRISKIPTRGFVSLSLLFLTSWSAPLFGRGHNQVLSQSFKNKAQGVSVFLWSLPLLFVGAPCLFSLGLPRPRTQWGKLRGLSNVTVLTDVAVWTVRSAGLARHSSSRDTQGSEDCSDRFSCNFGQFSLVQYSAVYCNKGITM